MARRRKPAVAVEQAPDFSAPAKSSNSFLRWLLCPVRGFSRLFFRESIDFEKKLQYLSKEEITVLSRIKRRTASWRKLARILVIYSVIIEMGILGFAIFATRREDLAWEARALLVLPVFLFPALAFLLYTCCARITRMRERRDYQTLETLRAERQAKINELKEKTNYYATQQLIQRYDPDPMAKAAAASILVSKLGAEAGLQAQIVLPGNPAQGTNPAVAPAATGGLPAGHPKGPGQSGDGSDGEGLRRRRRSSAPVAGGVRGGPQGPAGVSGRGPPGRSHLGVGTEGMYEAEMVVSEGFEHGGRRRGRGGASQGGGRVEGAAGGMDVGQYRGTVGSDVGVEGEDDGYGSNGGEGAEGEGGGGGRRERRATAGGWVARLAAMLVGEDPTQCYALICDKCHMHNGLARKEDFPYVTYYCPRCNHLNKGLHYRPSEGRSESPPSPLERPPVHRESDLHLLEGAMPAALTFEPVDESIQDVGTRACGNNHGGRELETVTSVENGGSSIRHE